MGLFSKTAPRCGNHHWGEWKKTSDITMDQNGREIVLKRKQKRYCLHKCDAHDTRLERVGKVDRKDLLQILEIVSKPSMKALDSKITHYLSLLNGVDAYRGSRGKERERKLQSIEFDLNNLLIGRLTNRPREQIIVRRLTDDQAQEFHDLEEKWELQEKNDE